jgi:plastocyanin
MPRARSVPRLLTAACAMLLGAAALSGCSHTLTVGPAHMVRMVLTEYRMNPDRIQVSPGPLTIVVRNLGRLNHNLAVIQNQQPVAETKPMAPGVRMEVTVYLAPGTYDLASTLFSDQALGLYGTLIVH